LKYKVNWQISYSTLLKGAIVERYVEENLVSERLCHFN